MVSLLCENYLHGNTNVHDYEILITAADYIVVIQYVL